MGRKCKKQISIFILEKEYQVESIRKRRTKNGKKEYFVKWEGKL